MRVADKQTPPSWQAGGGAGRAHRQALNVHYSAVAHQPNIPDSPGRHRMPCHRCDKGPRDTALSMLVEPDGSACWLCWRCGWRGSNRTARAETDAVRETRRQARAQREREEAARRRHAARRATRLWRSARPADPSQPYLQAKGVTPGHARQLDDRLVLPLLDLDGHLHSLQFIGPDGSKRFIRGGRKQGCVIPVSGQRGADRILICEGWATGMTLAAMEPHALVLAALDAGNLGPVAMECRTRWPDAIIIVCGDNDVVGRQKACDAALAARALVAIPETDGADWNDMARGVAA